MKRGVDHIRPRPDDNNKFSEAILTYRDGMSGDYEIAINKGSNMIRVGSKIFGERNY